MWFHPVLSAAMGPLLVVGGAGEEGPLMRGLSEGLEPLAATLCAGRPQDCFALCSNLSCSSLFHISSRSLSCFFSLRVCMCECICEMWYVEEREREQERERARERERERERENSDYLLLLVCLV